MKNQYEKPVMVAETFTPNNFVSSCDWWKVETTLSHYFYDSNTNGYYSSNEEIVNITPIYFQYSKNENNMTIINDDITLINQVNDGYFYNGYNTDNLKYQNKHKYSGSVYQILGTQTKGSTSQTTYWYTSANLDFKKSAS